jgi:hypothetical protein
LIINALILKPGSISHQLFSAPQFFLLTSCGFLAPGGYRRNTGFGPFMKLCKFTFKDPAAAQFVQVLAAFVAADRGNAGRPVDEPDAAFGLVLVLPALPASPESLHVAGREEAEMVFCHFFFNLSRASRRPSPIREGILPLL